MLQAKYLDYFYESGPRYISQANGFCCGPVGIVNSFKWLGFHFDGLKYLQSLKKTCGTSNDGTTVQGMQKGIDFLCKTFKVKSPFENYANVTTSGLCSKLDEGWAVLLMASYPSIDDEIKGHAFLVTKSFEGKAFCCINDSTSGPNVNLVDRKYIDWVLKHHGGPSPFGFVVRRLQETIKPSYLVSGKCAATSVINACRWLGCKPTAKDLRCLKRICKLSKSCDKQIDSAIGYVCEKLNLPSKLFQKTKNLNNKAIDSRMQNGDALLFPHVHQNKQQTSLAAWRSDKGDLFECVNYRDKKHDYIQRDKVLASIETTRLGWFVDHHGSLLASRN